MKFKQKLLTSILVTFGVLLVATPVMAAPDFGIGKLVNDVQRAEKQSSRGVQRQENQLDSIKKRADRMIESRISELNRLISRVEKDKRLSSDEKASITKDVQNDINSLNALKSKIDADTDLQTARQDTRQIVTNFKIFAVEVPKTRLLIMIDNLSSLATRLQGLTPKLQDLLNTLKSQGKDVSKAQSFLDDVNSRLQTIVSSLAADKTMVLGVSVTSTDAHTTFVKVRQDLSQARQSFAQVRHDIAQMRETLKDLIKIKLNQSPSATTK